MLIKNENRITEIRKEMRNGSGEVILTSIASKEELFNKARMFSTIKLNKNCSIGKHEHNNESEIFYIIKGSAEYCDDDLTYPIKEGDVTICKSGHSHAIKNLNDDICEIVTLIVLE